MSMSMAVYIIIAIAISGVITVLLRALPFAVLSKLRKSKYVKKLGTWMPVGIMLILATVTLRNEFVARPHTWWITLVSFAVTIGVHYASGRRMLWSVLLGTVCYVTLLAIFGDG